MNTDQFACFVRAALPEFEWVLSEMEKAGGWLNLPAELVDVLFRFKLRWWEAYEDRRKFALHQALMFVDPESLRTIQSREEAEVLKEAIAQESLEFIRSPEFTDSRPYSDAEKQELTQELRKALEHASEEERKAFWQRVGHFWLGFIPTFFDVLALMVHGRCIRQLVEEAKAGDDNALVLAVQIDRTVLFLPYFQERINKAQLTKDYSFLDSLGYRLRNPAVRGKIRRRSLWLLFGLLDSEGMLDMPLSALLKFCEDVGVYGKEFGVGDENSLGRRRREYRLNHRTRKYF